MKIGIIAPLYNFLPPEKYGGTEIVAYNLTQGLVKKGHKVTVFAAEGSKVSAKLDATWGKRLDVRNSKEKNEEHRMHRIKYIISQSNNFDIIHNHDGLTSIILENQFSSPIVTTWHTSFENVKKVYDKKKIQRLGKTALVSISNSQRKGLPRANFVATVYNGTLDYHIYTIGEGGDYLVWIGRFDRTKGPIDAVGVSLRAKAKLILAGLIHREDKINYFDKYVKNKIDNKQIKYIGEVNLEQKVPLLQKAKAFLMPIHWEEPFGLVMIEAMACGTPVIAYNRGSVPEIIEDGKNGFIVEENDIDGMVKAIAKIDTIDRKYCRESVKKRFSIEKMVSGYEKAYKKVIAEYKKSSGE